MFMNVFIFQGKIDVRGCRLFIDHIVSIKFHFVFAGIHTWRLFRLNGAYLVGQMLNYINLSMCFAAKSGVPGHRVATYSSG
jgi:hypothetical protein